MMEIIIRPMYFLHWTPNDWNEVLATVVDQRRYIGMTWAARIVLSTSQLSGWMQTSTVVVVLCAEMRRKYREVGLIWTEVEWIVQITTDFNSNCLDTITTDNFIVYTDCVFVVVHSPVSGLRIAQNVKLDFYQTWHDGRLWELRPPRKKSPEGQNFNAKIRLGMTLEQSHQI